MISRFLIEYQDKAGTTHTVDLGSLLINLNSYLEVANNRKVVVNPPQTTEPSPIPLLTVKELALYLKCSESTIHNRKRLKLIPYKRIGRSIFFDVSDVMKSLQSFDQQKGGASSV